MSFCPKCGREIIDESLGCPICGVKENTRPETTQPDEQPAEKVDSFTVEDAKGTYQKFGKLITIISAVMLGLSLICCIIGGLSGLAAVPYTITYNF